MRYYATDIDNAIARIDDMLRDLGTPANTGACQCSRCPRAAPAELACEPDTPDLPGGALVTNPHPLPTRPPGGIKLAIDEAIKRGISPKQFRRICEKAADEITF